ncbi:MAG: prolyl-tRNA synthetase associated domain-containing protein [Eubacterium sp.]|nr:prolyl-tRNA synthetase associated domain-containing protein [Eubacterium sp.]
MIKVSEVKTANPENYKTDLQKQVYENLNALEIPFERVDNEPAVTMDDCVAIDERLNVKTVKTLLLCNRQKTAFYLFITAGDKPFVTKDFSKALGVSRVSFAPPELLFDMLGVEVGATTVLSLFLDSQNDIRLVIDNDIMSYEYFGCTDSTTTGYMRIKLSDLIEKYIPFTNHIPTCIEV